MGNHAGKREPGAEKGSKVRRAGRPHSGPRLPARLSPEGPGPPPSAGAGRGLGSRTSVTATWTRPP